MKSIEQPKSPGQRLIDRMYLLAGKKIRLVKIESEEDLNKRSNITIEGILDDSIQMDKSISLDGKSKSIGILDAVRYGEDGAFFKTSTGVYELVNADQFLVPEEAKSEEYKKLEDKIESSLKLAQENAIDMTEIKALINERHKLQNQVQTQETEKRMSEVDRSLEKHIVRVETITEFKILMKKTGRLDYFVNGVVEHENAHLNKAGALGVEQDGYILIVGKDDKGFLYQPIAVRGKFPSEWGREEIIKASIEMLRAPEEYGNVNSPSDEEQIESLRSQLKK